MTDHWKDVQPCYPFSESPHRDDGPACYFADKVDAARAKDAEKIKLYANEVLDMYREITSLYALLDWALDAHAASKRREDILAQTLADALNAHP